MILSRFWCGWDLISLHIRQLVNYQVHDQFMKIVMFCSEDVKMLILLAWEIGDVVCIQKLVLLMWSNVEELCWRFALKQAIFSLKRTTKRSHAIYPI